MRPKQSIPSKGLELLAGQNYGSRKLSNEGASGKLNTSSDQLIGGTHNVLDICEEHGQKGRASRLLGRLRMRGNNLGITKVMQPRSGSSVIYDAQKSGEAAGTG